jgi:DNA repair protein RecO (recombination protein O)
MPALDYDDQQNIFDLQEGYFVRGVPAHGHYLDQDLSRLFHYLLESSLESISGVKMAAAQRQALLNGLLDYYRLHLDHFPTINAHIILKDILS